MSRVLIVDDEVEILEIIRFALEVNGHTVHVAECIAAARNILAENEMDIIITDFRLRGRETGLDLIRSLQATKSCGARTALITGFSEIGPDNSEYNVADFVFHKPFPIPDLVAWAGNTETCRRPRVDVTVEA